MKRALPVVALALTMTGCPWWGTEATPSPTPAPTTPVGSPTPTPGAPVSTREVLVSGPAVVNGQVVVTTRDAATGAAISGARVILTGPTMGTGLTEAGTLALDPLEGGTYSVYVEAAGRVVTLAEGVVVQPPASTSVVVTLPKAGGVLMGQVVDEAGTHLAGARVTAGLVSTVCDADGTYELHGLAAGATVTVAGHKTGYGHATLTTTVGDGDRALNKLVLAAGTRRFALENRDEPLGSGMVGEALRDLRAALVADGWTEVAPGAAREATLIASPRASWVTSSRVSDLEARVRSGETLIVTGEWGGAPDYSPEAATRLVSPYGLAVRPDLVRSAVGTKTGWLSLTANIPWLRLCDLMLFESASVFAPPPAMGIAYAGTDTYRIMAGSQGPCMVAARAWGRGLVVVTGDTTAWTSGIIPGKTSGDVHLGAANNRDFMLSLFRW